MRTTKRQRMLDNPNHEFDWKVEKTRSRSVARTIISGFQPGNMGSNPVGNTGERAMKREKYLKSLKSKKAIEQLISKLLN